MSLDEELFSFVQRLNAGAEIVDEWPELVVTEVDFPFRKAEVHFEIIRLTGDSFAAKFTVDFAEACFANDSTLGHEGYRQQE